MNDVSKIPPLNLGDLRFEITTQTRKRLFGRRPKVLLMVQVSLSGYRMEFDSREILDLANGPLIIEAVSASPDGDYFLASPAVIEPSSAVGASLPGHENSADSLLVMRGNGVLAKLSGAQQEELIAWLQSVET